jgi:lysophospholipase
VALAAAAFFAMSTGIASAEVIRDDAGQEKFHQKTPLYVWKDNSRKPRAVAIAVHGLTMHGRVYDVMARELASKGFVVLAPDLRGYGAWLQHENKKEQSPDYKTSYRDLNDLLQATKKQYPNLPLYCIGESLGAGMAMRLASEHPNEIDGLILSSPALRHRLFVGSMISETAITFANPKHKLNLVSFMKKYASEDPRIAQEILADPLVRKELSMWEVFQTCNWMRPNMKFANRLPAEMPILVIQGDNDRMLHANAVNDLLAHAKTKDQTIHWFNGRGHLLLETGYVQPDTLQTVTSWLQDHVKATQPTLTAATHDVKAELAPQTALAATAN